MKVPSRRSVNEEGSKIMKLPKTIVHLAVCCLLFGVGSPVGIVPSAPAYAQQEGGIPVQLPAEVEAVPEESMPESAVEDFAAEEIDAAEGEGEESNGALDYTLMELVAFGGVVGYLIIALSFVAVALVVDDALLLRRKVLMPPGEVEELGGMISEGRYSDVTEVERASFVGAMTSAGVYERGRGYEAVVKAMEDSADGLTGRLLRRIEYLNIIANVTPMLGLLGTVIGMVKCFNQISVAVGGVDPRLLAAGIFQALMTTVMGLIVAIPALFAFSMFRNRVDSLAAEATKCAEDIVAPLRPADGESSPVARLSRASS